VQMSGFRRATDERGWARMGSAWVAWRRRIIHESHEMTLKERRPESGLRP
jgi:hypothetical protein